MNSALILPFIFLARASPSTNTVSDAARFVQSNSYLLDAVLKGVTFASFDARAADVAFILVMTGSITLFVIEVGSSTLIAT